MKSMQWLALVVAAIVVLNLRATGGAASKPPAKPAKKPAPAVVDRDDNVVDGYGETEAKARAMALERAQKRVEDLLRRTGWTPSAEQLEPDFLARFSVVQPRGEPAPALENEKMLVACYRV